MGFRYAHETARTGGFNSRYLANARRTTDEAVGLP
jgi:hypothetical protein